VDTLANKLVKEIEEDVVNSDTEARDVDRTDDVVETSIPTTLSNLGSQIQPDKGVDMVTPQSSPLAVVLHHVVDEIDEIVDDGNLLQDEGVTIEVNNTDSYQIEW